MGGGEGGRLGVSQASAGSVWCQPCGGEGILSSSLSLRGSGEFTLQLPPDTVPLSVISGVRVDGVRGVAL